MDTLQAAVLSVKLDALEGWSKARRDNAEFYNAKLKNVQGIRVPHISSKAVSIYNQYTLVCEKRDELLAHLQAAEIGCAVYYPLPLHVQECFSSLGYKKGDLPVAEEMANKVLSIPIYPELSDAQKKYVCDKILAFYH
jgi:dTDP-4-amino-4,6-dideoxygalactose transaminase